MKKLVIIQTATPDYRAGFFNVLQEKLDANFELYSGDTYYEASVKSDPYIPSKKINNHYLIKRKFLFQTGIWHLLFKDVLLVIELNPRTISNWILLLIRKIIGLKTVVWGHAWPRKGKDSKSDALRSQMRKLATAIVVYTNKQKTELQDLMPNKKIFAAPNSLFKCEEMSPDATIDLPYNLIYVGRLTIQKKPFFLAKAFANSLPYLPEKTNLYLVGEGEEKKKIEDYIQENKLEERIFLMGHISNYEKLKTLYSKALFSVSPGYVGLSITQSFGFGVPILVSENEDHSPEIEAVRLGENALYYKTDDLESFSNILKQIFKDQEEWINKSPSISAFCKENYSVEAMAQVFINLANQYGK